MKTILGAAAAAALMGGAAEAQEPRPSRAPQSMHNAAPVMSDYTDRVLFGSVWERPGLAKRDRSLVTVAALIASGNAGPLANHLNIAIENGVQPREISGLITHLAFYAGWPNAVAALGPAEAVFRERGVEPDTLRADGRRAPPPGYADRAAAATQELRAATPALADLTSEVIYGDLWLRPELALRDRSLVTMAALIAGGDLDLLPVALEEGLANGLSANALSEAVTHLAFYAGWPKASAAAAVLQRVVASGAPSEKGAASLNVTRSGASPMTAPASYFTGAATVDTAFQGSDPARIGGARVTFEAGARTHWHTHPLGQTLVIVEGTARVGHDDGSVVEAGVGDIVFIPPGVRHWHGATPTARMSHVAVAESLNGQVVSWMEPVTDAQYGHPVDAR